MNYFNTIPKFELMFWFCAIPFSLVFFIQVILSFSGFDHSDADLDGNADLHTDSIDDHSTLPVFTFRNFVIFLMVYGWAGLAFLRLGISKPLSILFAVCLGSSMMLIVAYIFYSMSKLQESGNIDINNAVNSNGSIYLSVPAGRTGTGKIQLTIQGAVREYDAITDETTALPTGDIAMVTGILNNNTLIVKKS